LNYRYYAFWEPTWYCWTLHYCAFWESNLILLNYRYYAFWESNLILLNPALSLIGDQPFKISKLLFVAVFRPQKSARNRSKTTGKNVHKLSVCCFLFACFWTSKIEALHIDESVHVCSNNAFNFPCFFLVFKVLFIACAHDAIELIKLDELFPDICLFRWFCRLCFLHLNRFLDN
jgi:hypothetical protein